MNLKIANTLKLTIVLVVISAIFANSVFQIYKDRDLIVQKIKFIFKEKKILPVNPLTLNSQRQIPPASIKNLTIDNINADREGMWSAPVDWNVNTIHLLLMPNGKVMSYGVYGVVEKEKNKSLIENKQITLSDGLKIMRDNGDYQWTHHNVQAGVDFDIWDPSKGFGDDSHQVIHRPLVWDAFCSIAKVIDNKTIILLGGNKEPKPNSTDTQSETIFYDVENNKFTKSQKLNYPRWYGSIVTTGNDEIIIVGGHDKKNSKASIIPEILKSNANGDFYWKTLDGAKSEELFGNKQADEWSYPKINMASDGSIIGVSYNKIWKLDHKENGSIKIIGEIPLQKDGFFQTLVEKNPNLDGVENNLFLGTIGSPVGSTSVNLMINNDLMFQIGGWQWEDNKKPSEILEMEMAGMDMNDYASYETIPEKHMEAYLPSNQSYLINFNDSNNPQLKRMANMNFPRSGHSGLLLPTGDVFVHGGVSVRTSINNFFDKKFSVLTPEIYDVKNNKWKILAPGKFRRNYHSSQLLLPDGSILIGGGDVWNAEVYYPPYLFERIENNKLILAKRPEIKKVDFKLKRGENTLETFDEDVVRLTLISTGSTTHNQNTQMKFHELNFKKINNNKLTFNIDLDKNKTPKGTYLLFLINKKGTPSIGKITYID